MSVSACKPRRGTGKATCSVARPLPIGSANRKLCAPGLRAIVEKELWPGRHDALDMRRLHRSLKSTRVTRWARVPPSNAPSTITPTSGIHIKQDRISHRDTETGGGKKKDQGKRMKSMVAAASLCFLRLRLCVSVANVPVFSFVPLDISLGFSARWLGSQLLIARALRLLSRCVSCALRHTSGIFWPDCV